jgi:hypothetical protein
MNARSVSAGLWRPGGIAVVAALFAACGPRVAAPPPADAIVSAAVKTAREQHKVALVEFGASWCVWCKRFDAFVHTPAIQPIIDRNYVVTHLTVLEHPDKKALDNPGGDAVLARWGGADGGIPFYAFLDANGTPIATSNAMPNGTNIGFPGNAREVAAFLDLIARTAPHLQPGDRETLAKFFDTASRP